MRCTRIDTRELHRDRWTRLRHDTVRWENGVQAQFSVIERMAGAAVLPIAKDGTIVLVREFKYALGEYSLEAEAGGIEEGEAPLAAAQRELAEEVGLAATTWIEFGRVNPLTAALRSPVHLFLARGLSPCATNPDETEFLERVEMKLSEAIRLVETGGITGAGTCVLLLRAARQLGV